MMRPLLPLAFLVTAVMADDAVIAEKTERHQSGSQRLSDDQDQLAAEVQQLTIEQTSEEVIALFREVEDAMDEASERLLEHDTGGETIAAETEVIEKIHAAAKARQQQSGQGQGGAMMDMLERMMGKEPGEGKQPGEGEGEGEGPGEQGGKGQTGDSDSENEANEGKEGQFVEERRVPKGSGVAGRSLPPEFNEALKAFNRASANPTP
ncbi:MAG: hypothetical protein MUF31_04150 [Akkermansiaceae bacterium]|jgi:hypothetical protein|nr:hypothetical protein [Akkermansiaceae bacterium]